MQENGKHVIEVIKENYSLLYSAEKKVADYILKKPNEIVMLNVSELANKSNVSDATVVRMCQHLGFKGYYQMRLLLSHDIGQLEDTKDINIENDPLGFISNNQINYLKELKTSLQQVNFKEIIELILKSDKIIISASGNTIPIAMNMEFRLSRLGLNTFTSTISEQYMNYINNCSSKDILIAISKSGTSTRVLQSVQLAKKRKCKVIAITDDNYSPLQKSSDFIINTGKSNNLLRKIQHGLESHIGEIFVVDCLLFMIGIYQKNKNIKNRGADVELEVSSWKM